MTVTATDTTRRPVPRGIARSGPAILSYGFRPFFLAAGLFAVLAMVVWLLALQGAIEIGGTMGPLNWHAHEMLFGYTTAALAGFLLTAIPNWTGRLPVSGRPLLALFTLWLAGRLVMAMPHVAGPIVSAAVDTAFLPVVGLVAAREVIAGRNWKNLKVLIFISALALSNIGFHIAIATEGDIALVSRAAISVYVLLIALIGGRIVPSFTRNFIVKTGGAGLPVSFGRYDAVAIAVLALSLGAWTAAPTGAFTGLLGIIAAALHFVRLWRWRGWLVLDEPLLAMLHVSYAFVPIGMLAIGAATARWIGTPSALHVLTVGAIGGMTLAVMTRASLGHTGRPTVASPFTATAFLGLLVAAIVRPFAELLPDHYHAILATSGAAWLLAFGLFVLEYAPILCSRSPAVERRRATPASGAVRS